MINDWYPIMDDEVSMATMLDGRGARSRFMAEHYRWALRRAKAYGARQDAEDIVQDVFSSLLEAPPTGARASQSRAVLSVMIHRRLVDHRRRQARAPFAELYADLMDDRTGLSTVARQTRLFEEVQEAMRRLQTLPRAIVEMRYFEGLNSSEIAQRLALTDSTVRGILFRALSCLRRELGVASR